MKEDILQSSTFQIKIFPPKMVFISFKINVFNHRSDANMNVRETKHVLLDCWYLRLTLQEVLAGSCQSLGGLTLLPCICSFTAVKWSLCSASQMQLRPEWRTKKTEVQQLQIYWSSKKIIHLHVHGQWRVTNQNIYQVYFSCLLVQLHANG